MASKRRTDDKGRVLRNGEQQRTEDGRYLYRYSDSNGRRKTVYSTSLSELRAKEKQIEKDLAEGIDTAAGDMTLNQLFDLFMSTKKDLKQSTIFDYKSVWKNNIESTIGQKKICDLKAADVRKLYADLADKGLSAGSIKRVHSILRSTFELAVDSDWIRKNPTRNCSKVITGEKHQREGLTRAEQAELMDFIKNSNTYNVYYPMVSFLLGTGLRCSEMCGLRWSDVDLKNNIIHVRQQLVYKNFSDGKGCTFHLQTLKTENAKRDIPISASVRKALLDQKQLDMITGVQRQTVEGIADFVFVNTAGNPWLAGAVNGVLDRIVTAHNKKQNTITLPHVSAHTLRHSFASRMLESGLNAKTLQVLLGHADVSTTLNVYVTLDQAEIEKQFHAVEADAMAV